MTELEYYKQKCDEFAQVADELVGIAASYDKQVNTLLEICKDLMKDKWTPCSEGLPKEDGEFLVWFDCGYGTENPSEDDEKGYAIVPFDTEQGAFGYWQDRYDAGSLGFLDTEFIECETAVAWQPLPKPYGGTEE